METINSTRLDAGESAFFARELEHIKAQTYDVKYPEYKATRLIPVSTEAGPGADSITYRQFDAVGLMKIIANYADDLPRSDVKGLEFNTPVRSLGGSYGYNLQEIRSATKTGRPLQQRKANAARQAYEQAVNRISWFARAADGVYGGLSGLFYNANVTKVAAPQSGGNWIAGGVSADDIILDMNQAVNDTVTLTLGVEVPNTLLLPLDEFGYINTTPRSSVSDTTILKFFQNVQPDVMVEQLVECADVNPAPSGGAAPTNLLVTYKRDPDKLTLELPQLFEQLPVQERNLEFVVDTHARIGGVIVYYPLSVRITEAI